MRLSELMDAFHEVVDENVAPYCVDSNLTTHVNEDDEEIPAFCIPGNDEGGIMVYATTTIKGHGWRAQEHPAIAIAVEKIVSLDRTTGEIKTRWDEEHVVDPEDALKVLVLTFARLEAERHLNRYFELEAYVQLQKWGKEMSKL